MTLAANQLTCFDKLSMSGCGVCGKPQDPLSLSLSKAQTQLRVKP